MDIYLKWIYLKMDIYLKWIYLKMDIYKLNLKHK